MTSAFSGLMYDKKYVGDGEGGDIKTFGTTIYSVLIFTLAYKVRHSVETNNEFLAVLS